MAAFVALASRDPELAAGIRDPALRALQAARPRAPPGLPLPLLVALPLWLSAAATPPPVAAAAAAAALLGDSRMRPLLALVACHRECAEAGAAETGAGEAPAA